MRSVDGFSVGIEVATSTEAGPVDDAKRKSCLKRNDGVDLPSSQEVPQHPRLIFHERNFPKEVGDKAMTDVEIGPTVVQGNVDRVHEIETGTTVIEAGTANIGVVVQGFPVGVAHLEGEAIGKSFSQLGIQSMVVGGDAILAQVEGPK